jgi:hypothetical protein
MLSIPGMIGRATTDRAGARPYRAAASPLPGYEEGKAGRFTYEEGSIGSRNGQSRSEFWRFFVRADAAELIRSGHLG